MGEAASSKGQSSLGASLGAGAGTAWRMLRGAPGRNQKWLRGARAGIAGFAGPLKKVLHLLFLEISGLIFLLFSLSIAVAFLREYRKYTLHEVGAGPLALAGGVGVMFLYFGVSSFWRARRRRSKA